MELLDLLKLKNLIGGVIQWVRKIIMHVAHLNLPNHDEQGVVINICQRSATFKTR